MDDEYEEGNISIESGFESLESDTEGSFGDLEIDVDLEDSVPAGD